MVLLTSSTVSAIVSMGVVCMFTLALFLAGYTLQQQSVKNIQHAMRVVPDNAPVAGLKGGGSTFHKRGLSDSSALASDPDILQDRDRNSQDHRPSSSTGNYAYLQLLSEPDPSNICSAVLFFKQLATNSTAIQDRLFMYPEEWDRKATHNKLGRPAAAALSILRAASLKYDIWLLPIDMTAATREGFEPTDSKLLRLGQNQFMQYDSVLYVHTPGLLLDSSKLDDVLLSRPLPLRHDRNRKESYNNEAWIPAPLRPARDPDVPPVYLIAVNNVGAGKIETRTHIPNMALSGFNRLVTGPWGVKGKNREQQQEEPGYVYFESDADGRVKWSGNPLFGTWRAQQAEVCDGLDLDSDWRDEQ
ncbi:uncharacterized protein PFLUO_LOCUS6015 [Penicillium psychrofluorescens]|uniref:uncharacterized protein n=1 Tax=Penicillium psychrofluorescens TaxID=3158075 RepID=UPI003CCE44E6